MKLETSSKFGSLKSTKTKCFITLLFLLFSIPVTLDAHKINGYKFLHVAESGNKYGVEESLKDYFQGIGFKLIESYEIDDMGKSDKSQLLIVEYKWEIVYGSASVLILTLNDITGKAIYKVSGQGNAWSAKGDMKKALKMIYEKIDALNYTYNPDENKAKEVNMVSKFNTWTEDSIKNYLRNKPITSLEGIYKNLTNDLAYYRIAILKEDYTYYGIILDTNNGNWKKGETKMTLSYVENNVYDIEYYDFKGKKTHTMGIQEYRILKMIVKEFQEEVINFYKIYPSSSSLESDNTQAILETNLKATGSGFIISENVVATNYHVIENAGNIRIGLKIDGSLEFYNAKVLSTDKTNDLALLTVKDEKFKAIGSVPYKIISNTVDVGTSVFTMGYPMSNVLGEEVKITDGLISSKTGYEGDAVTYQISAPIQPGNSGGALFDKKGRLVGITNAGVLSADNVGYAIKSSYLLNLIDSAPIDIPVSKGLDLTTKELPEIIRIFTPYIAIIRIY
ncbi:MAG: trypsin-like peptidase domain-containing protein [Prevotella sp.]|nr:trypsin-like peptidase domain-containing protein [Prevotella sp.]